MSKSIVITGYPYAYPYYFKVFEYAENKDELIFILPKHWEAKGGKVKINFKENDNFKTYKLSALSYGGKSLLSGLFKGWMPSICFILPLLRLKNHSRILFSCLEPNLLTTLYNGVFAKLFGYKHFLFTWQNVPPEKRMSGLKLKLSNILVKLNLAFADGIICGNKKAADIVRRFKVESLKFKVLTSPLSGVDVEKFRPGIVNNWREKFNFGKDEKFILFYGALEKRKGLDVLIDTLNNMQHETHNIQLKLVIVGTGPEGKSLRFQAQSLKLKDRITFLDWMPNHELPFLLNAADVFVCPSVPLDGWEEQFGYAMAEASACGVPVVATNTGSIEEVIIRGKSGFLVEPNNPEQLAEAIYKILSNQELAKQMGEFGRNYVVENYSHEIVAQKLVSFLMTPT